MDYLCKKVIIAFSLAKSAAHDIEYLNVLIDYLFDRGAKQILVIMDNVAGTDIPDLRKNTDQLRVVAAAQIKDDTHNIFLDTYDALFDLAGATDLMDVALPRLSKGSVIFIMAPYNSAYDFHIATLIRSQIDIIGASLFEFVDNQSQSSVNANT